MRSSMKNCSLLSTVTILSILSILIFSHAAQEEGIISDHLSNHHHHGRHRHRHGTGNSPSSHLQLHQVHLHPPPQPPPFKVEIDPRYGVDKRLVPSGPNPLHN
ncbi:hypothetical protein J5N97_028599 [Dioscorea zingiberensis]|uniref:CLAVATA3/ESR (CLE)-related protein 13 n=1 Tax=Dioscorea zingiberensis TaxID=325984 RepID=A0A9D5BZR2_9LILI|nr:hypothetical protein J5N97_028599 [Dioscorea zingiberensis]